MTSSKRGQGKHKSALKPRKLINRVDLAFTALSAHPLRLTVLGVTGAALLWLVVSTSLTAVLAPSHPDLALLFSPNHPAAQLTKAETLRARYYALAAVATAPPPSAVSKPSVNDDRSVAPDYKALNAEREEAQADIIKIARQILQHDPLNSRALLLLAETTSDPQQLRSLMTQAVRRSKHEALAAAWLLNDAFNQSNIPAALDYADILLRSQPSLVPSVLKYLGLIAEQPAARAALTERLAVNPPWRAQFFSTLPSNVKQPNTPFALMVALKEKGQPPSPAELGSYLNWLLQQNLVELAYANWQQLQPAAEAGGDRYLNNATFERDPSGLPFDWKIARGQNAMASFGKRIELAGARTLDFTFSPGRVRFPEVTQVLVLPSGAFRFEGKFGGPFAAKRGLRWQFRCNFGARKVLAETEMLQGQSPSARQFAVDVTVTNDDDCRGQELRLYHDARSASEEMITGEGWFSDLQLIPLDRDGKPLAKQLQ
jgi:hypothetical protein